MISGASQITSGSNFKSLCLEIIKHDDIKKENLKLLTKKELEFLDTLSKQKHRRWIAGRIATKKSIISSFPRHSINEAEISIANKTSGAPYATINKIELPYLNLNVSISHCDGIGVAIASTDNRNAGIGIDIERIRKFKSETIADYMTKSEHRLYQSIPNHQKNKYATFVWSTKEAVLKAQGYGLRKHPKKINLSTNMANLFLVEKIFDEVENRYLKYKFNCTIYLNSYVITTIELL